MEEARRDRGPCRRDSGQHSGGGPPADLGRPAVAGTDGGDLERLPGGGGQRALAAGEDRRAAGAAGGGAGRDPVPRRAPRPGAAPAAPAPGTGGAGRPAHHPAAARRAGRRRCAGVEPDRQPVRRAEPAAGPGAGAQPRLPHLHPARHRRAVGPAAQADPGRAERGCPRPGPGGADRRRGGRVGTARAGAALLPAQGRPVDVALDAAPG